MQILVNTDGNIDGREELTGHVKSVVEAALSRLADRITRVEVHLSDENGDKRGQRDKRCMMEARLEGSRPTAVTHQAATLDEAVDGAAGKLKRSLETTLDKRKDRSSAGRRD